MNFNGIIKIIVTFVAAMGVDVTHIIRNDFHGRISGDVNQCAVDYCLKTIETLKQALEID